MKQVKESKAGNAGIHSKSGKQVRKIKLVYTAIKAGKRSEAGSYNAGKESE